MKIYIQSYIDIITNSSTTVFTWAYNINGVKEIINSVLKASGSNLTCDDLFDISISYNVELGDTNDYYIDTAKNILRDINDKELSSLVELYEEEYSRRSWKELDEIHEAIYNILVKNYNEKTLDEWAENFNNDSYDYKYSSSYVITAKNSKYQEYANTISSYLDNLFDHDVYY